MSAAFLISLREGLEAALIIGILLGSLKQLGQSQRRKFVWVGVLVAAVLSGLVAAALQIMDVEFEGQSEQIFEGVVMLIAVGLLTWMIFWMRTQSRKLRANLEKGIRSAVRTGKNWGLTAVAFVAVFREGVETALFLSASAFATGGRGTLLGAILGLIVAFFLGFLIYASSTRVNIRIFFLVTSALLLIFAAGLLSHAIHEFQEAGLLPIIKEHLWNTNHILDEASPAGEFLKTLLGYNGNPSLLEVIAYWSYWAVVLFSLRRWDSGFELSKQNGAA
jgi:high-affinity iron transporter